jgi:hypothetical protein
MKITGSKSAGGYIQFRSVEFTLMPAFSYIALLIFLGACPKFLIHKKFKSFLH